MNNKTTQWLPLSFIPLALAISLPLASARAEESEYKKEVQVTQILKSTTTTLGQPLDFSKLTQPEVTGLKVVIPPGKETGWHKHPSPGYGYVLEGVLTLEVEGNRKFVFKPGSAFVEVVNTLHNGKNLGDEPLTILVFFTGEAGKPFTIRDHHP